MEDWQKWFLGGLCFCLFVVLITLFGLSFSKLESNEVGFDYSENSRLVDFEKLYTGGVHVLGVGHKFIKFTTAVTSISLEGDRSVSSRTSDGLLVILEGEFQYRLNSDKNRLGHLWMMFQGNHEDQFYLISRSVIRDVSSRYSAFQFWTLRSEIQSAMQDRLQEVLSDVAVAPGLLFNLRTFSMPRSFENAITATDRANQEINTVSSQIASSEEVAQTILQKAFDSAKIVGLQANTTIAEIDLTVSAQVAKIQNVIREETTAFELVKSQLAFSNEELAAFVWLDTLQKSDESIILQVDIPSTLKLQ